MRLIHQLGSAPPMPPKQLWGRMRPEVIENRMLGLNHFLQLCLGTPIYASHRAVSEFLEEGKNVPPEGLDPSLLDSQLDATRRSSRSRASPRPAHPSLPPSQRGRPLGLAALAAPAAAQGARRGRVGRVHHRRAAGARARRRVPRGESAAVRRCGRRPATGAPPGELAPASTARRRRIARRRGGRRRIVGPRPAARCATARPHSDGPRAPGERPRPNPPPRAPPAHCSRAPPQTAEAAARAVRAISVTGKREILVAVGQ